MSKYPFVPKEYYPAVQFACKMIRENGHFNKAVRVAANYYGVNETVLAGHIRKRQGAGQKGQTRKYKFYVVVGYENAFYDDGDGGQIKSWNYTEDDYINHARKKIVKATESNKPHDRIQLSGRPWEYHEWIDIVHLEEFDTKEEAARRFESITKDDFCEWLKETKKVAE